MLGLCYETTTLEPRALNHQSKPKVVEHPIGLPFPQPSHQAHLPKPAQAPIILKLKLQLKY